MAIFLVTLVSTVECDEYKRALRQAKSVGNYHNLYSTLFKPKEIILPSGYFFHLMLRLIADNMVHLDDATIRQKIKKTVLK